MPSSSREVAQQLIAEARGHLIPGGPTDALLLAATRALGGEPCTCTLVCTPQAIPPEHYCREEASCAN